MVLLRIRVYPEPVRSRKLCHKWSIFPCYSATAWVPFGQCIHFLLDPYSHLSILFIYQNGLHGKIMNKRYGIPLHSIVLLALLLAAGGFARVFPVHPTNGSARFDAPEYIQPLLIQEVCPPGSDEDVPSFKSKAPPPDPGTHLAASASPPVPPLTQGRLCSLIPECPRPSWRGLLPFSPFPHLPFDPLPFVVCAPRVRASRAFPFPGIVCGQVQRAMPSIPPVASSVWAGRGAFADKAALPLHPLNGTRKGAM